MTDLFLEILYNVTYIIVYPVILLKYFMIAHSKEFFTLFSMMYWISEGVTEAFTWSNDKIRINNSLVFSEWAELHGKLVQGLAGYHTWRYGEMTGIFGMMVMYKHVNNNWFVIGITLLSWFMYQRMLGITRKGEWFPEKSPHRIGKLITIQHKPWLDVSVAVIAITILILS